MHLPPLWTLENASTVEAAFANAAHGMPVLRHAGWATEMTLDGLLEQLAASEMEVQFVERWEGRAEALLIVRDESVARDQPVALQLSKGNFAVRIAAGDALAAEAILAVVTGLVPSSEAVEGFVPVTFWVYGPHGPDESTRSIAVPQWADVEANYPAVTRAALGDAAADFRPSHGGQLVLWHGPPGTGKTHALRALAWEWRDWARLHVVIDPDRMFGDHADYLVRVLTYGDVGDIWKILVLEDTGELLAADAKERTGQGLSRLLNTVDGLIGQGMKVLVLVTTNEELKALHPAVTRPGRCALNVEFEPFSAADAWAWLDQHGVEGDGAGACTLAELYAAVEGFAGERSRKAVGFGVRD